MTSYAENAAAEPRRRREPRPRRASAASRARPRSTFGGVVWIVVVAVLRLNVRLDKVSQQRVDLQADVARLQSALSSAGASAQISSAAQSKLGLVPADPNTTRYLKLEP